jgi:hypothetical protein
VATYRRSEPAPDRARIDGFTGQNELRVVGMVEGRRQVVADELRGRRDRDKMQAVIAGQPGDRARRLAGDQGGGGDLAALDLLQGFDLRHADFLDLDVEGLEEVPHEYLVPLPLSSRLTLRPRSCSIEVMLGFAT